MTSRNCCPHLPNPVPTWHTTSSAFLRHLIFSSDIDRCVLQLLRLRLAALPRLRSLPLPPSPFPLNLRLPKCTSASPPRSPARLHLQPLTTQTWASQKEDRRNGLHGKHGRVLQPTPVNLQNGSHSRLLHSRHLPLHTLKTRPLWPTSRTWSSNKSIRSKNMHSPGCASRNRLSRMPFPPVSRDRESCVTGSLWRTSSRTRSRSLPLSTMRSTTCGTRAKLAGGFRCLSPSRTRPS